MSGSGGAERLRLLFESAHARGEFNGNVLLASDGEPLYAGSFGFADRRSGRRLTANTMFNIASVSKTFVAMAVVLLRERGMLRLDEPLEERLQAAYPDLPYAGVTIRHLLTHTSGIPNYIRPVRTGAFGDRWTLEKRATNAELITELAKLQPVGDFAPGSANAYSNTGYLLLAELIRLVSGQPLAAFLKEAIFAPFGLDRTIESHDVERARHIADYAIGMMRNEDGTYALPHTLDGMSFCYYLDELQGDGNVHASAPDLLKWDQLLYTEKLLPQQVLEEAYVPVVTGDGQTAENGLGWFVRDCGRHGRCVEHSGYWPGYGAEFRRYPEARKTLILLTNEEFDGSYKRRTELADEAERLLLAL